MSVSKKVQPPSSCPKHVIFLYSRDRGGEYCFAFARKLSQARLKRRKGIFGSDDARKLWGRWTCFERFGKVLSRTPTKRLEFVRGIGLPVKITKTMKLEMAKTYNLRQVCVNVFVFSLPHSLFSKYFPRHPELRAGEEIVNNSHGNFDALSAFSIEEIKSKKSSFASYVLNIFAALVSPHLQSKNRQFKRRYSDLNLSSDSDKDREIVPNRKLFNYWEMCKNKEVNFKKGSTWTCPFQDIYFTRDRPTLL